MAIGLAFKAFFQVLFHKTAADAVRTALDASSGGQPVALPKLENLKPESQLAKKPESQQTKLPSRSDALTLLSTLQREARFLDLVAEPLDAFEDAQVGAAARQVIADVKKTLDRMFAIEPLAEADEGTQLPLPKPASPVRYHITGTNTTASNTTASNTTGHDIQAAVRGTIVHRGWKADRCQTPTWNGLREDAFVLSPIEIEIDA